MTNDTRSKEAQILEVMRKVLTDVARDTYTKPGLKHPLSENTIVNIRDCLALISARESELAKDEDREMNMRPRYVDEPKSTVVIPIDKIGRNKDS
ncbi:MAG: segregation and condensation protein A [Gammaproteobacteria bacterium]|nr:segregation and condensation protein A [Gammaproteobacteria bacterium]